MPSAPGCAAFEVPEPAAASAAYGRWLHDKGEAARACGDHSLAADVFERLLDAARAQGRVDVRGVAVLGLARAWLEMEADGNRAARLDRALALLDALLTEDRAGSGHLPDTMEFARSLRVRVQQARETPAAPRPPVHAPVQVPAPQARVREGGESSPARTRTSEAADDRHASTAARRAQVAGVASGGALLVVSLAFAGVAIGVRPWYGRRYRDDPGYTREVAREITEPWVVGYGVASATAAVAGAVLIALFAPRLDKRKRRRQTNLRGTARHVF